MGAVVQTLFGTTDVQQQKLADIAQAAQPGTQQYQQALAGYNDATARYQNQQQAALGGVNQQQALLNALAAQGGIGNQSAVFGQQQALANQLGAMAQGAGPNPAQAALAQATGQNVAQQAALMAGQRGAGANAGLLARQAAQQGAGIQQQAAGQAATMQAQQQLNAIGALQAQQGAMAGLAGQQVGQQMGATGALNQALLNQQQMAANQQQLAAGQQSQAAGQQQILGNMTAMQNAQQTALNQAKTQAAGQQTGMWGNIAGAGLKAFGMAEGGQVADSKSFAPIMKEGYKGTSKLGHSLFAKGGVTEKVPVIVSPGEHILTPEQAKKARSGKMNPMASKEVPGQAAVGGAVDDYANDTVPMKLEPGSVVLPRSVTKSKNPDEKAKKFVEALKSKKGGKK